MKSPHTGLSRIWYAVGYSWKGVKASWQHEVAFRQELVLCVVLTPVALWLGQTVWEVVALLSVLLLVLIVELLNSAIESVVDRIGEEYHALSGRAKDQGSAAVLLALMVAILVWGAVIYKRWMGV
ncbi:Diacylglycerol kinase [hydrothermal vent metagenome]|uniref:Diacylglycerol kinase n=1 Tax=hydrothermal vent metagenome TaxID=652676 RepID=A0A3B0VTP2_9ZZZZ